jgi:lysophospholipase L1-like esterase
VIADRAGAKLSCRDGRPDATCAATRGRCLGSADCVLDDWNRDGTTLVACAGDSNTVTGAKTQSWCVFLPGYLNGVTTQSVGLAGTRASDDPGLPFGSPSSSHVYLQRMLTTWSRKPDVIVLAWGTNDIGVHDPEEIVSAIDTLAEWMRREGIVPLVASVPRRLEGTTDAAIASVNAQLAARYGPCLIDFTTMTPPTGEWYHSSRHVNQAGQRRRAIAAYRTLKSAPRSCASGTMPPG